MTDDEFVQALAKALCEKIEDPVAPAAGFFRDEDGNLLVSTETHWGNGMWSRTILQLPESDDQR